MNPVENSKPIHNSKPPPDVTVPHPSGSIGGCPYHSALKRGGAEAAEGLRLVATQMMRERTFGDDTGAQVEKVLIEALQKMPFDPKGETNHLLGVNYFHLKQWGDAIKHLEVTVERDPENADAKRVLASARTNSRTGIERPFGPTEPIDGKKLSENPALSLRIPDFGTKPPPRGEPKNIFVDAWQTVSGKVLGPIAQLAVVLAKATENKDEIFAFKNWDGTKSVLLGEARIGALRDDIVKRAESAYDDGVLSGFQPKGQPVPPELLHIRTATGAYNDPDDPMAGAAGTPFSHIGIKATEVKDRMLDETLPSPRELSRAFFHTNGPRKTAPFLNDLALAWIQAFVHGVESHRPSSIDGHYEIPLAADDPFRERYKIDHLDVPKSAPNPQPQAGKVQYANENSAWIDASIIYGNTQEKEDQVRMGPDGRFLDGGKLRIDGDLLPLDPRTGIEQTGFSRNWWVGLDIFHTLMVKHHNYLCDEFAREYPGHTSDRYFHWAKLNIAGTIMMIHNEWVVATFPNKKLVASIGTNTFGAIERFTRPAGKRKFQRWYEPKDRILGGLLKGKRDNYGKNYAITQPFVNVYRFHTPVMDSLKIKNPDGSVDIIPVEETRGTGARVLMQKYGLAALIQAFGEGHFHTITANNMPDAMTEMSTDQSAVVDIGTNDITHDRQHGVPPFNEGRESQGLKKLRRFEDLGCSPENLAKLKYLYCKNHKTGQEWAFTLEQALERMDPTVGQVLDNQRPENFPMGEPQFQPFIFSNPRRIQADRFFTTDFDADTYTPLGMKMLENVSLKQLLLLHCPELANTTRIKRLNNLFEPVDTDAVSHPEEHPLTSTGAENYAHDASKDPH